MSEMIRFGFYKLVQKQYGPVKKKPETAEKANTLDTGNREIIVKGLPASPGNAAGKAHVIINPEDIDEFKEGEILVTAMTAPDWVPAMKKAKAIVTDAGGMTCHASIVSRELGIPCIVGTKSRSHEATTSIKDGQMITVDATNGIVYDGVLEDVVKTAAPQEQAVVASEYIPVTGTKVYMNLGDPDLAENMVYYLVMVLALCVKSSFGLRSFTNIHYTLSKQAVVILP